MKKTSLLGRVSSTLGGAIVLAGSVIAPLAARAVDVPTSTLITNITTGLGTTAGRAGVKSNSDLATVIGNYIYTALGLLGVVLVVLFIYAGFLWMTAQGAEDKVKKAKAIISNAVVGTVLIFAAYAITTFVVNSIATSIAP